MYVYYLNVCMLRRSHAIVVFDDTGDHCMYETEAI
jgi:hypothetical protein